MNTDDRTLWVFTLSYPFGHGEAYIGHELTELAQRFRSIRVFPMFPQGPERPMPAGVSLERLFTDDVNQALPWTGTLLKAHKAWPLYRQCLAYAPEPATAQRRKREVMSMVRQALRREQRLRERYDGLYRRERPVLYSYWASDWATVLGLWRRSDRSVRPFVRMHGFDLYDYRSKDRWPIFQPFHVATAERIFFISRDGLEHVGHRFPEAGPRSELAYLGTPDHGMPAWAPAAALRVVSCSALVPLKRVPLIAEALQQVRLPVHWTHFGDGVERPRIEQALTDLPPHVQVDLRGAVANAEVLDHYARGTTDVFLHVSRHEGLPVALMEAASHGIPLVACRAGGVGELVGPTTGRSLPVDISAEQLAAVIDELAAPGACTQAQRDQVRAVWQERFNGTTNAAHFSERLLKLA